MEVWLSALQQWIKKVFKGKSKKKCFNPTKIIQSWNNKDCIVLQLERNIPGAIATYRINQFCAGREKYDYLITLDYLFEIQAVSRAEIRAQLELEKQLGTKYNVKIRLRDRTAVVQTHRFAVFRIWRDHSLHCIQAWDLDLEGFNTSYIRQQSAPKTAVRSVARSVLLVSRNLNVPNDWQFQIEHIDWLFLLRNRIREGLSSPHHNLHEAIVFPVVEIDTAF